MHKSTIVKLLKLTIYKRDKQTGQLPRVHECLRSGSQQKTASITLFVFCMKLKHTALAIDLL